MRDVMAGYIARGEVSNVVALVSRRGDLSVDTFGAERDAIFRITSMTKPVVAVAALILVEEGVIGLDDPVEKWLPELSNRRVLKAVNAPLGETVPAQRSVTLRDLMTFRMGIGLVFDPSGIIPIQEAMSKLQVGYGPPDPAVTPEPNEWMKRLGTLPLMCQPGERWLYNTAFDVLGVLVARVSGRSLETFLQQRIFEPLGMKDTAFSVPAARLSRLTPCQYFDSESGKFETADPVGAASAWSQPPKFESGGAGLVSTADDYLAFALMLLNGGEHGGHRLLSRLSVEGMTMDHLTPAQKALSGLFPGQFDHLGFGFGVAIEETGRYGWDGGFGTSWRNDPARGVVGILMTSRTWDSPVPPPICQDFWSLSD